MIRKLWVKFNELDVVCVCNATDKHCGDVNCTEYIVKFTPKDRTERNNLAFSPKARSTKARTLTNELNNASSYIKTLLKETKTPYL